MEILKNLSLAHIIINLYFVLLKITYNNYQERIIKYLSFDKYLKIAFKVLIAVYKLDQRKEGQS